MPRRFPRSAALIPAALVALPLVAQGSAFATPHGGGLQPGDLLLATTTFQNDPNITAGTTQLPPGCGASSDPCGTAVASGNYPYVFNNDTVDGSFGVTSEITLDELDQYGRQVGTVDVPTNQMVTSFSSKSELALNLSTQGRYVSFMGYDAAPDTTDVSNANTPGVNEPGYNPIIPAYYRVIAQLGSDGNFHFTLTNAYSGDNGRAAITNDAANVVYSAGNSANSDANFIESTGAQIAVPAQFDESAQRPGAPTPVGSFGVNELGLSEGGDVAKENNYRGIAAYGNVLYYSKGSGGKGINSIYFVDTTGKACPGGVGVPRAGAQLPTEPIGDGNYSVDASGRLTPQNMCILAGFPQQLNHSNTNTIYPFGMFFASPDVLYVADEGNGNGPVNGGDYSAADPTNNPTAGLQKWVFDRSTQQWQLAYTLQSGLGLGAPYTVAGLPSGLNSGPGGTGEPWAPATDGLRALAGRVNPDGTVSIYATTSTVSGNGDQGADANRLVEITDRLDATRPPAGERFDVLRTATSGTLFRGISFTPGTPVQPVPPVPHGRGGPDVADAPGRS